ncbi:MAG: hypothetical protein J7502_17880, partial [Flavisolibacter sp.]|nr:hypothetical protein [Flavisolibacter sp.]
MDILFNDTYKSLENIGWKGIPEFCVITGKNGSGKTQLLQLIYSAITKNWIGIENFDRPKSFPQIKGVQLRTEDVVYLRHDWQLENLGPAIIGNIQGEREQLYTHYSNHRRNREGQFGTNLQALFQAKKNDNYSVQENIMTDLYDRL